MISREACTYSEHGQHGCNADRGADGCCCRRGRARRVTFRCFGYCRCIALEQNTPVYCRCIALEPDSGVLADFNCIMADVPPAVPVAAAHNNMHVNCRHLGYLWRRVLVGRQHAPSCGAMPARCTLAPGTAARTGLNRRRTTLLGQTTRLFLLPSSRSHNS